MRRVRLNLTGAPGAGLMDVLAGRPPALWDADALKVQVFLNDLETKDTAFDITTLSSLTLEVRQTDTTSAALIGPLDPDDTELTECSFCDWNNDEGQHAVFTLTDDLLDFVATLKQVWLSIRGETTDGESITFGAGYVKVAHSGPTDATPAPVLMLVSQTPDETTGEYTFSASGCTFTVRLNNFASAGARVGPVRLTSTTPDATTGEYSFSAGDCTWTMVANAFTES